MEDAIYAIVSDLETNDSLLNDPNSETPISELTLLNLQTLLDFTLKSKYPIDIERIFDELSAKNLSPSSVVASIISAMDSGPTHISLLASKVYLSLLLSPNPLCSLCSLPWRFCLFSVPFAVLSITPPPHSAYKPTRKKKGRGGGRAGVSRFRAQNVREYDDESESAPSGKLDVRVLFSVLERAEHGDQLITAAEVLKSLSPSMLLLKSQAHAFALGFVVNKIMGMVKDSVEIKKAIVSCFKYLVNKAPEKSKPRAAAVESIIEIVQAMEFDIAEHIRQEGTMTNLLKQRIIDEKAAVKKAALLLTSKLTGLLGGTFDGEVLKTVGMSCSDPLVSIRKATISALSEVFRTFWDENVTKKWLHSVPRLIIDNESSIQEEYENLFLELVLDRISRAGSTSSSHSTNFYDTNGNKKCVEKETELLFPEGVLIY